MKTELASLLDQIRIAEAEVYELQKKLNKNPKMPWYYEIEGNVKSISSIRYNI